MQTNSFHIGNCPVCCGNLEIITNIKNGTCSIMCDECSAEWNDPENALKNFGGSRATATGMTARAATLDEIRNVDWEKYIAES